LQYTSPSTSAFITGLYVMFTPFIEAALATRVARAARVRVGRGCHDRPLSASRVPTSVTSAAASCSRLACAFLFAIWIVYQGGYAARLHPIPFTTMQMVTLVVVGLPAMARQGVGELTGQVWFAIIFTGIACSAVALSLQLWGQRRIPPSRAALILLMEPVFAGLAGYIDGERLGAVEIVGAFVILAAIAIAELGPGRGGGPAASRPHCRGEPGNPGGDRPLGRRGALARAALLRAPRWLGHHHTRARCEARVRAPEPSPRVARRAFRARACRRRTASRPTGLASRARRRVGARSSTSSPRSPSPTTASWARTRC
jgi:hypothetical protein